ncbi:hypothetical protein [Calidifontibacillus erzurumensis]
MRSSAEQIKMMSTLSLNGDALFIINSAETNKNEKHAIIEWSVPFMRFRAEKIEVEI